MRIRSMTGFGKADVDLPQGYFHVFMRGVNSKSLEVLFHNYPEEFVEIEEKVRNCIEKKVKRGRIDVFFKSDEKFSKHKEEIAHLYKKITLLEKELRLKPAVLTVSELLMIAQQSNIFKKEKDERPSKNTQQRFLATVNKALEQFIAFKEHQGGNIAQILKKLTRSLERRLDTIAALHAKLTALAQEAQENIPNVEEEIALARFYIQRLNTLIFSQETLKKGKFLDFLSQEILRELNTLLSKLKDKNLCLYAIQMKVDLESIREQVQNIE